MTDESAAAPPRKHWNEIFNQMLEGGETNTPDTKSLADLLRSDEPLPAGFRLLLAEALDSVLPGMASYNWQLVPTFTGRRDKLLKERNDYRSLLEELTQNDKTKTDIVESIAERCGVEPKTVYDWQKAARIFDEEQKRLGARLSELLRSEFPPKEKGQALMRAMSDSASARKPQKSTNKKNSHGR